MRRTQEKTWTPHRDATDDEVIRILDSNRETKKIRRNWSSFPLNGRAVLDEALDSSKQGRVLESWPFDYARAGSISTEMCLHFPWRNRKKLSVERVM